MAEVKAKAGVNRRERAKATRERILNAACEQFSAHGYVPTTMDSIAAEAGVAIQTVYYVFRTKAQLLREATEFAGAAAAEAAPVMERDWMSEALASADPTRSIALVVEHGVDIYARVAQLIPALRTAASVDEDIEKYWRSVSQGRREGMGRFVSVLKSKGFLTAGLDAKRAADIMFVLNSHESFLGLTESGWTIEEFKAWLYTTLCHQLISPSSTKGSRRSLSRGANGLSFEQQLRGAH